MIYFRSVHEAVKDRHVSRTTWYHPSDVKKQGGGKANWGREGDFYDPVDIPINEPFADPGDHMGHDDYNKIRVHFKRV